MLRLKQRQLLGLVKGPVGPGWVLGQVLQQVPGQIQGREPGRVLR